MEKVLEAIRSGESFLIIGHVSPDGDTVGSAIALKRALIALGKQADIAIDGAIPEKLGIIAGGAGILTMDTLPPQKYSCAVAVDCGDLTRLGRLRGVFECYENTVSIDHHGTNTHFAAVNFVRSCAATGIIICELIEALGVEIDVPMANALYTAISTDTGNFSYTNVDEYTLRWAAQLRGCGADVAAICEAVYRSRSFGATKLIGRAIDRIALYAQGRIAVTYVLLEDYARTGAVKEDCDELINYAREIQGVEIAAFLREIGENRFKLSLRSCAFADVSRIAVGFHGGGHRMAAGGSVDAALPDAVQRVVEAAARELGKRA